MSRFCGNASGGIALFRHVRFWSRRWVLGAADSIGDRTRVRNLLVLEAIDAASSVGDVSVAHVAAELGIDYSGASRFIKDAEERGYVKKLPSEDDSRRMKLSISWQGRELLTESRKWQEEIFDQLVSDWPESEAAAFAQALERLASEVTKIIYKFFTPASPA